MKLAEKTYVHRRRGNELKVSRNERIVRRTRKRLNLELVASNDYDPRDIP